MRVWDSRRFTRRSCFARDVRGQRFARLFYPFAWIVQAPEPLLVGKAAAVGVAEMFLPALLY